MISERDTSAFGNENRATGYTGSLALQTSATSGNSDTSTVVLAPIWATDGMNGFNGGSATSVPRTKAL
jgi:hypothetical protein